MEIKKKLLAGLIVIGLLTLTIGLGTYAYFNDTETSTGNVFQAGTIDLTLTGGFEFYDIKPCEELAPVTVEFRNIGQNPGYLYNKITYENNDKTANPAPNLSADEFAALIYIEAVTYQHWTYWEEAGDWGWGGISDDLPGWLGMDLNTDGFLSLYEMKLCGWLPYNDLVPEEPLLAGDGGKWVITFHMADSLVGHTWGSGEPTEHLEFDVLDNGPQADGIDMIWTAVLNQLPETLP